MTVTVRPCYDRAMGNNNCGLSAALKGLLGRDQRRRELEAANMRTIRKAATNASAETHDATREHNQRAQAQALTLREVL